MNPIDILKLFYDQTTPLYNRLFAHSDQVAIKAMQCAKKHDVDHQFIQEAALLHDIGIFLTDAPCIECFGDAPYVCHGYLGMQLLEKIGLHKHARVCARHVGVGLTVSDIKNQQLPLPEIDMQPETMEEIIVCYADKFFSKTLPNQEKSVETVLLELARFGARAEETFLAWHRFFD